MNDIITNYESLSSEVGDMLMHSKYTRSYDELLAKELNKTKAIFINQIHYWTTVLHDEKHFHEGKYWVYESYKSWQKQFPSMTTRQIQNILISLEADGYIFVGNFNEKDYDKTKWYAVNYEKVKEALVRQGQKPEDIEEPYEKSSSPIPNISIPNISLPKKSKNKPTIKNNSLGYKINGAFPWENALSRFDNKHIENLDSYMAKTRERLAKWEETRNDVDYLCQLLEYYFCTYQSIFGEAHPPLRPEHVKRVCDQLLSYGFDVEEYCDMIDRYFANRTMDTDHNILHFVEDEIIINRAYENGMGISDIV